MKTSCLSYPPRDSFLKLHRSLCTVCDDDPIAAALLQFLAGWHDYCLVRQEQRAQAIQDAQRHGEPPPDDCGLWQRHSMAEFEDALMGLAKEDTIRAKLQRLEERGFIATGAHPVKRYRWDQTTWYRFYPDEVQKALDTLKPPDPSPPASETPASSDTPQTPVAVQSGKIGDADPKNPDSSPEKSGVVGKILDLPLDCSNIPLPIIPPQGEQEPETDIGDPAPAAALPVEATQPEPTECEGEVATAQDPAVEAGIDSPAGATPSAAPQPVAAEPPGPRAPLPQAASDTPPTSRPRGCEHLPEPPNQLQQHWVARFPDEAVRDAWFEAGKRRLRRKKGGAVIGDCIPSIIAEALQAYDEFVQELVRQGRQVNGEALWPPKRE